MSSYQKLTSKETLLKGKWTTSDGAVIANDVSRRIEYLIQNVLIQVATDDTGWVLLYKDPDDGRYWELSYPHSEAHGGGAPELRLLNDVEAQHKYPNLAK